MADSNTPNLNFTLSEIGASSDSWGGKLNENWSGLDSILWGSTGIRPNLVIGQWEVGGVLVTSSAAQLNIMNGVTANTSEINILAGAQITTSDLNRIFGLTSNAQTQLNGKQSLDDTLTALASTGTAANKVPYFTGADVAAELNFRDQDDMAADDALGVASQQSIRAYVGAVSIGSNQTWQDVTASRVSGTTYQNTTVAPIMLSVSVTGDDKRVEVDVSTNGSTWVKVSYAESEESGSTLTAQAIVPQNHYYRATYTGTGTFESWVELR